MPRASPLVDDGASAWNSENVLDQPMDADLPLAMNVATERRGNRLVGALAFVVCSAFTGACSFFAPDTDELLQERESPPGEPTLWLDASRLDLQPGDDVEVWPDPRTLESALYGSGERAEFVDDGRAGVACPEAGALTWAREAESNVTLFVVLTPSGGQVLLRSDPGGFNVVLHADETPALRLGQTMGGAGDFFHELGLLELDGKARLLTFVQGANADGTFPVEAWADGVLLGQKVVPEMTRGGTVRLCGARGVIHELVLYPGVMPLEERLSVERYLQSKWRCCGN